MEILKTIWIGAVILTGSFFQQHPSIDPANILGASYQTGEVRALFETTLASRIASTDTSFTLSSATDKDGTVLASSTYGFIIDEGTSVEEMVLADCTSTACTNVTRGLSARTGTTTVSALRYPHNRSASVKMTDAPALIFATNVLKGKQNIEQTLRYTSAMTPVNAGDIIDKAYADGLAFGGVPEASETASGFIEIATQLEAASSTSSGTEARLALPASSATSTYNSATAPLRVVVTQNSGKIDDNFIATSTLFNGLTLSTTTSIGAFPAWQIGKQRSVITTTGTSTFARPSGITRVFVRMVAGGGNGGNGGQDADSAGGGGGGGSGGYLEKVVDLSATSSIQVYVGAATERTTFGTIGYEFASTTGGTTGSSGTADNGGDGGAGGTAAGGDINISGATGNGGGSVVSNGYGIAGGMGASSPLGGGGGGGNSGPGLATAGHDGGGYGSGGGGSAAEPGSASTGGNGKQGVIIISW